MSLGQSMTRLVKDPPPAHVFELSEAGIAHASSAHSSSVDSVFRPLPEGALEVSPVENNVRQPEAVLPLLGQFSEAKAAAGTGPKRRRTAAVLLPDACARISVLDFDGFPTVPAEQLALVRFRVKKTIPFDIDSAAVAYFIQPGATKGKTDVVSVTVALEVLARYEALFRNAGFHAGDVTVSSLAMLNLYKTQEPAMLAKLAGKTLTAMVVAAGKLRLFRCVTLESGGADEIRSVLYPTFAYAEDELGSPIRRAMLCGFDEPLENLPCESEPVRGRFGMANPFNAGLIGYLEATSL